MTTKLALNLFAVSCLTIAPAFALSSDRKKTSSEDSLSNGMSFRRKQCKRSPSSHKTKEAPGRFRARACRCH